MWTLQKEERMCWILFWGKLNPSQRAPSLLFCFGQTDWQIFRTAATNGHITNFECKASETSYISKCIDNITVSKTIPTCSNRKLLKRCRTEYTAKDPSPQNGSQDYPEQSKVQTSPSYKTFTCLNNLQPLQGPKQLVAWQGIEAITNDKTMSPVC